MVTPLQMFRDWRASRRHLAALRQLDRLNGKSAAVYAYRRAIDAKTREIDRVIRIQQKRRQRKTKAAR